MRYVPDDTNVNFAGSRNILNNIDIDELRKYWNLGLQSDEAGIACAIHISDLQVFRAHWHICPLTTSIAPRFQTM